MLKQAREREQSEAFKETYKRRAGLEGTIAQAVNPMGARHNRYRGLARTRLQHIATAAALNLRRIAAWLMGDRPGTTRSAMRTVTIPHKQQVVVVVIG